MSTPTGGESLQNADAPITNFSQCHVGIIGQLTDLGELPALVAPAARARRIAVQTLALFEESIIEHHAQEERELFPVVLEHAVRGEERDHVKAIIGQLTAEHRKIESAWSRLKPALTQLAKGHDADLDEAAVRQLVADYRAHAAYEEEAFLPLAQRILARDARDMAALGLSLHMRQMRQLHPVTGLL